MEKDTNWFNLIKLSIEENENLMSEELQLMELIFNKYNFMNLADYSRANNISPQGVLKRMKAQKQAYITLGNTNFYF